MLHASDSPAIYAEACSERALRPTINRQGSDKCGFVVGENACSPMTGGGLLHVVLLCAEHQMTRVHAWRNVALV